MTAIFISHSSRDNAVAGEIKTWLEKEGYERIFLDLDKESGLDAGKEWERELYESIRRCHAAILLVTTSWVESKWCFAEFTQARALGKMIFPVLVAPRDATLLGPVLNTVQAEQWSDSGRRHMARRLREVAGEIAMGHSWESGRQPWPGIMSFEFEDRAVFFGRDPEVRQICERLEARRVHGGARLLLIVGASGSGKSSVLKAGVLPYLRWNPRFKALPPFRPGTTPVLAFAKVLAEALGQASDFQALADKLRTDPQRTTSGTLDALRVGPARDAVVLIAIDQFEELFMLSAPEERDALLRILTIASASANDRAPLGLIVGTVRSDLLGEILSREQFPLAHEVFTLANLPYDRIRMVIEGPARVASVTLGDGLVDRILGDVGASLEALPLLAFTLRKLNEHGGSDHKLTIDDYEALGDRAQGLKPLEDAIRRTVEDTLAAASPSQEELEALRIAFVGPLVRVNNEGVRVRRPARLRDLGKARRLIDKLADARLLSIRTEGGSDIVEVAHEALFKVWPTLASWLDADQNFLIGLRQIEDARRQWLAAQPMDRGRALMNGLLLENAREWWGTNPERLKDVEDFIVPSIDQANRERDRQKRRRQQQLVTALGAAAVFAVIAVFAGFQWREAENATRTAHEETAKAEMARDEARLQTKRATINETRRFVELAENAIFVGRPVDGLKLALEAWPEDKQSERPQLDKTLGVISKAISEHRMPERIMRHDRFVRDVIELGKERVLVASGQELRIWNTSTGQAGHPMAHKSSISGVLLLDESHLLSWCDDGSLHIWNLQLGEERPITVKHSSYKPPARIGENHIVSWDNDGLKKWAWRADEPSKWLAGKPLYLELPYPRVDGALALADGNRVLAWADDGTLRLWDPTVDTVWRPQKSHGKRVRGAQVVPDGRILSWSDDQTLHLWDPIGVSELIVMPHDGPVAGALALSDKRLLSWSDDGALHQWDMKTGVPIGIPMRHAGPIDGAIKLSDTRILSWSRDGMLRIWDIERSVQVGDDMRHTAGVYGAKQLPDKRILSWSENALMVWDAITGQRAGPTMHHDSFVIGAMMTDQGLLSWSADGTVRLWRNETVEPVGPAMPQGAELGGAIEISRNRILAWSTDKIARIWDVDSGTPGDALDIEGVMSGAFEISPDLIVLWGDKLVVWNVKTGKKSSASFPPIAGDIRSVAALPPEREGKPKRVLSRSFDGSLRLWDANADELIGILIGVGTSFEFVEHVQNLRNDRILVRSNRELQVLHAADGKPAGALILHEGVQGAQQLLDGGLLTWSPQYLKQWSPTGEPILSREAATNLNGIAKVLLLPADQIVLVPNQDVQMPLLGERNLTRVGPGLRAGKYIRGAQALKKGQVLSWTVDGTMQIWDPGTQSQIATAWHHGVTGALEMSRGRILSWSKDGILRLWQLNLPTSSLFDLSCALLPDLELKTIQKRYAIDLEKVRICGSSKEIPLPDWKAIE